MKKTPDMNYLIGIAQDAGNIMMRLFIKEKMGNVCNLEKAQKEIITQVNHCIKRDYPHIDIFNKDNESQLGKSKAEFQILYGPIDGSFPFRSGLLLSTFSIALLQEGVPILSCIYSPFSDKIWRAEKGSGSFFVGRGGYKEKLQMKDGLDGGEVHIMFNSPYELNMIKVLEEVITSGYGWRNHGALAYIGGSIAQGKFCASIFSGKSNWETAVISLIASEAGARVTDLYGQPFEKFSGKPIAGHLISDNVNHTLLLDIIKSCQN